MQSLTFRTGARKTEVPVRMKTTMPVTLCSLVEKNTVRGELEILSDHSQPPASVGPEICHGFCIRLCLLA